jgi:hypothetical protein
VSLGYADWDAAGAQVEAAGFAIGVVESGGTCTLTLTRNGAAVSVTSTGAEDATTTNCGRLTVPGAQVGAGDWQAVLSYRSGTAHGTSTPVTVKVPTR